MEATFIHSDPPGPNMNSSYFRVFAPAQALTRAGHTIHLVQGGTGLPAGPHREQADLIDYSQITPTVLLEREASPELIRRLRYAGAERIVFTFDDHYGKLPDYAPRKSFWTRPGYYEGWVRAQNMCDGVIVAGPALTTAFIPTKGSPARLVHNYIDANLWRHDGPWALGRPRVIGWGGTREHRTTWDHSPLLEALSRIQADFGAGSNPLDNRPTLMTIGHTADPYLDAAGIVYMRNDLAEMRDWPSLIGRFDIGLAPLRGAYDQYRSHLKVLEYASLGIPWIATDAPPYAHAEGGILIPPDKREAERWYGAIKRLLIDTDLYANLSRSGYDWSRGFTLDKCVPVYEEILWPKR